MTQREDLIIFLLFSNVPEMVEIERRERKEIFSCCLIYLIVIIRRHGREKNVEVPIYIHLQGNDLFQI